MNKIAVAKELVRIAKGLVAYGNKHLVALNAKTHEKLGMVVLRDFVANHFLRLKSFPAIEALSAQQIKNLKIDDNTEIYFIET
jgi:hypothetical protein